MIQYSHNTVWASILAFGFILFVLGLLLCIPFLLARLRGVNPRIDRFMDTAGRWMHADPPSTYKGSKQPASKQFLRSLKVTNYAGPTDVEAAAEDCCAICCCEYEAGQTVIHLSCRHMFHKDCIVAWLKVDAVCPICKTALMPQPEQSTASGSCTQPQHTSSAPTTAAAAAASPAAAAAGGVIPGVITGAAPTGTSGHPASSAVPVSPRMTVPPALRLQALGSPMLGVAGISP